MYLKTIDKISWFIPFRNLRDNVRYKLIDKYTKYYKNKKLLINEVKNISLQKNIFKANVNKIEVEIHSYCNRKCWFCPNSIIDRHSKSIELNESSYIRLLENLKEINYSGIFDFVRYNEPLSNRKLILKRLKQAREYIPNTTLKIYTNGDYLTSDYLDELRDAGLNDLHISYYYNGEFDIENNIKPGIEKLAKKLNLKIKNMSGSSAIFDHDLFIFCGANNFENNRSSRGGIINTENMDKNIKYSCTDAFSNLYIDYNGAVMPCCELRSDYEKHSPMILGNINDDSIFNIFTSKRSSSIRKYLEEYSIKKSPCDNCTRKHSI